MRRSAFGRLGCNIRLATLSLKLDVLIAGLERRYRPDQPRAPTPEGGRWIDELAQVLPSNQELMPIQVAVGPRCDGFAGGCQSGGTFGTTGMFNILGRNMCLDCAVKYFSIENLNGPEQMQYLMRLDPDYRRRS
jgi:hypothetical protein